MIIPLPQTGQGCPTNESGVLFGEETGVATRDGDTSVFASFDSPASEFFFSLSAAYLLSVHVFLGSFFAFSSVLAATAS